MGQLQEMLEDFGGRGAEGMSMTFTKLFSSITESTVWGEPDRTRLVWITMLAMSDKHGRVFASVPGLARRAIVPVVDTRKALDTFLATDPDSRTPDNEGRRIEAIDGGWRLLNHGKYRMLRDEEDRRAKTAERVRRYRIRHKNDVTDTVTTVTKVTKSNANAEADTEADTEKESNTLQSTFEQFWQAYPKKTAKVAAEKAFKRVQPDQPLLEKILAALERFTKSPDWQKDEGKFVPYPATWLNGRRWEDEQGVTNDWRR